MSATRDHELSELILAEARNEMRENIARIRHCVEQLSDEQVWWRPRDSANSIGNLLLHLCGNMRQRFCSVVKGEPDDRNRPLEFSERGPIPKAELLNRLDETVASGDAVLAGLKPEELPQPHRYPGLNQTFEKTTWGVAFRTLLHLAGHTQEIVYITRLQLGDAYRFQSA